MSTGGPSHRDIATMTVAERPAGLPEPRASSFNPGDHVGRYIVESELGRGGTGVVLAATDPSVPRRVALKVVRPDDKDPQAGERMMREARALAALQHPNVVAIHDVGNLDDGQIFLAMELVEGRTLRAIMRDGGPLPAMLDLFVQAGRGLGAAHDAGFVHRDFKPDRVLVGTDGRARVTDFGLVRGETESAPAEPGRPRTLNASSAILGTPAYMAPEQHLGGPASPEADQFAFAVALYEALAGEQPFQGTYDEMQGAKLGAGRMPWPSQRPIPPTLMQAIDRALLRDPRARHPSMRAFLEAIATAGRPAEVTSSPRLSGTPTAMSAPLAPGANPQYLNTRPPPAIQMYAPPPRPDRTLLYVLAGVGALVVLIGLGLAVVVGTRVGKSKPSTTTQRIPPPGPLPPMPAFTPIPAAPTPDSKFVCPPGTTFHKELIGALELYCSSAANSRDGTLIQFDANRRMTRYETRVRGKLEGQSWAFSEGGPLTMQEYHEGLLSGASYKFSVGRKIVTREHYENNTRHGLTENWNPITGEPTTAELYNHGVLIGTSF